MGGGAPIRALIEWRRPVVDRPETVSDIAILGSADSQDDGHPLLPLS